MRTIQELVKVVGMPFSVSGTIRTVSKVSSLRNADDKSLCFYSPFYETNRDSIEAIKVISKCKAAAIICSDKLELPTFKNKTTIQVINPRLAFARVVRKYFNQKYPRMFAKDYVAKYLTNHDIKVYPNTKIGERITIHTGAVIGSDGFGFVKNEKSHWEKFPQLGGVIVEDDVEIGANTTIDCATFDNTIIGKGTKIDNLVHVAHNCIIGKHCFIAAGTVIGGSTIIGDNCWIGINATIRDQLKIGNNVTIGMGAVVGHDIPDGATVTGNPARIIK